MTPQEAVKELMDGNKRYLTDQSEHPNRNLERRQELTSNQAPFAIIVSCSDSRVAPEIIFDQGLGDLFVVRVAGNVISETELESIKYSALYLKSSTILVMGHENCGAVDAVIQNNTTIIPEIAKLIYPAVKRAKQKNTSDLLKRSIQINAMNMANVLKNSPDLQPLMRSKQISINASYYDLTTGSVKILN